MPYGWAFWIEILVGTEVSLVAVTMRAVSVALMTWYLFNK